MGMIDMADTNCWLILISSVVTGSMAVLGLVSRQYEDTFAEALTMSLVALSALVVAGQIYEYGYARRDGMAALAISIALYSVAQGLKHLPRGKDKHP